MTLRTERLALREFTMDDVAALYALESIPEVVRYQSYPPRTPEEAREVVAEIVRGQGEAPRRHVELAVCLADSPEVCVSFGVDSGGGPSGGLRPPAILRDPFEVEESVVDAGEEFIGRVGAWIEDGAAALWYAFMPSARGRGYATEAVQGLMEGIGPLRFTIECDPRNEPSWRLAERLGFRRESLTERAFECKGEWVGSVTYGLGG